jgi:hypothetical protein
VLTRTPHELLYITGSLTRVDRKFTSKTEKIYQRFLIALKWATYTEGCNNPDFALRALMHTLDLIPHTISLIWSIHQQMEILKEAYGLSCRAAAAALSLGRTRCAVELLECGRGVIWSQHIRMRGIVGPYHPVHRDTTITKSDVLDWTEIHHIETRLEEAFLGLRAAPGYERFLIPPSFQDICDNISGGYIALLVPSKAHCDVILLGASGTAQPHHLRLPRLNMETLKDMISTLTNVATAYRNTVRPYPRKAKKVAVTAERQNSACNSDIVYNKLLMELWTTLVVPIVERLGLPVSIRTSLM